MIWKRKFAQNQSNISQFLANTNIKYHLPWKKIAIPCKVI